MFLKMLGGLGVFAGCDRRAGVEVLPKDAIVIGAGISGLAAARALSARGVKVIVVEARARLGGRMWTDHSLGSPVDMGACWIHGQRGNPIMALAKAQGLETLSCDHDDVLAFGSGGRMLTPGRMQQINQGYRDVLELVEDEAMLEPAGRSYGELLREVIQSERLSDWDREAFDWILSSQIVTTGALMDEQSARYVDDDRDFAGGDRLFARGCSALCEGLAKGLDVRFGCRVKLVELLAQGKRARITLEDGASLEAGLVVVTLPLGVLKAAQVRFRPELPVAMREAIEALDMGVLDKVALRFDRSYWPDSSDFLGYMPGVKGGFPEFLNLNRFIKQPILVGLTGGQFAREREEIEDKVLVAEALKILRDMLGSSLPEPTSASVVRWGRDPFAVGAYSHVPPGATSAHYDALSRPWQGRMILAGEACSRHYRGTMHGAYLSGASVLERLRG